jgi:hypothetical protein
MVAEPMMIVSDPPSPVLGLDVVVCSCRGEAAVVFPPRATVSDTPCSSCKRADVSIGGEGVSFGIIGWRMLR